MKDKSTNRKAEDLVATVRNDWRSIQDNRLLELINLAKLIKRSQATFGVAKVMFICTHNSRRSHLADVWFRLLAQKMGVSKLESYSGGTEATAFNPRMVLALQNVGFIVKKLDNTANPSYTVSFSAEKPLEQPLFSKVYSHSSNPHADFIAIMVCSDADENCPYIPTAFARFVLTYTDPKAADDSSQESEVYQAKVMEIGREMAFLIGECR